MSQPNKKIETPGAAKLPKERNRRRGNRIFKLFLGVVTLGVLAVGAGGAYVYSQLQPMPGSEVKQVEIPPGSSVAQIGRILEQEGLIKNSQLFRYYVQFKGLGDGLQAGTYRLPEGQTIEQLLAPIKSGDVVMDMVRFTIPEGLNVEQIAAALEKKGLVQKEAFLKEINEGQFPEYPFVAEIPNDKNRKYRLEGYLFPETYDVKKGATEHEIIAKMLSQFSKEFKPEWVDTLKKQKLTVDEAVNLASIVEREVVADKERPIVAGVFFNRIRDGWMLQSCATVQFVLGKQRDRITFDDLKIESPYNTYIHKGLPPGPIASPGRTSLAAVVEPAKHDYFFFVTKKDGTSEHFFSKTLEEHLSKDAKSRGNW
ncbi:MAG: endolytic transglycosylase MltG [Clostridia bacterium]